MEILNEFKRNVAKAIIAPHGKNIHISLCRMVCIEKCVENSNAMPSHSSPIWMTISAHSSKDMEKKYQYDLKKIHQGIWKKYTLKNMKVLMGHIMVLVKWHSLHVNKQLLHQNTMCF